MKAKITLFATILATSIIIGIIPVIPENTGVSGLTFPEKYELCGDLDGEIEEH